MAKISALLGSVAQPEQNDTIAVIASKNGFLTAEECQRVITQADAVEQVPGGLGADDVQDSQTRSSGVKYLLQNEATNWLYGKIGNEVIEMNRQGYRFDLTGFEAFQVATYNEGDHYDWHIDLGEGDNSTRKLAISVQLSDENDYEGGDLDFMKLETPSIRSQGSIIFFPSFMYHRVLPVTRGCRKSLVAWVHGNAFR